MKTINKTLYIARYSTGSHNDYTKIDVFVTEDKELVEKWVEKFNTKLEHWKEYFKRFGNAYYNHTVIDEIYFDRVNNDTFYRVMGCNGAFYSEIECRKSPKKI
jgi:hypothetical protein